MSTPLISIIIPAYNVEDLLPKTLDSVLAQTHSNIEVVIVNDGSKDGTASVMDDYARRDHCIKAIHKENGGVTSARLRGVAEASGDWIGFVDGDDLIEPDMYERLIKNALAYDADISHCGYQMILPSGNIRYYYNTGVLVQHDTVTGLQELLSGARIEPALWNKLFHKSLFHRLIQENLMDLTIKNQEDWLMNFFLFRQAKSSVYEDFCPYRYVVRRNSAANAAVNLHQLEDPLKVKQILFQQTADEPKLHPIIANQLVRQLVSLSTISVRKNPEITKPVRKNARKKLRRMIPNLLTSSAFSMKFKIMGLWAAVWPWTYRIIHQIYEKASGIDKIYEK